MSTETSKYTLVCFKCRQTAKAVWVNTGKNRRCPQCGGEFENVGKHFNIPKRSDDKGWKASEAYWRQSLKSPIPDKMLALTKKWAARRHPTKNHSGGLNETRPHHSMTGSRLAKRIKTANPT